MLSEGVDREREDSYRYRQKGGHGKVGEEILLADTNSFCVESLYVVVVRLVGKGGVKGEGG